MGREMSTWEATACRGPVERQALGLDLGDLGFERLDGGIEFGGFHLLVDRLHGCDLSRSGTLQFV